MVQTRTRKDVEKERSNRPSDWCRLSSIVCPIRGDSFRARELYGKLVELAPDSDRAELHQARTALQVSGG